MTPSTHLELFYGQLTQIEVDTSFPTTREDPMYITGNKSGLDDGDAVYLSGSQVLGIHVGGTWLMIPFITA